MLGFAQQEGKREGGHTWWVLVAGEETDEGLRTWRRTGAADSSETESQNAGGLPGEPWTELGRDHAVDGP